MIAALATLAFAGTLWLVAVLAMQMLAQSGAKVRSALNLRPLRAPAQLVPAPRFSPRVRARAAQPMRAMPDLRAAA